MTSEPKTTPTTSAMPLPGCCADELPGFQILKIVIRYRRNRKDDAGREDGIGNQRLGLLDCATASVGKDKQQRGAQNGKDAHAGLFDAPMSPAI